MGFYCWQDICFLSPGISQRHTDTFYKFILDNRLEIIADVQAFFYHIIKDNFPDKSCMCSHWNNFTITIKLIDIYSYIMKPCAVYQVILLSHLITFWWYLFKMILCMHQDQKIGQSNMAVHFYLMHFIHIFYIEKRSVKIGEWK